MPASEGPGSFRRLLVALDSAAASGALLESAAAFAAAQACELSGLFVEDEDLLRLAGLPFARETQLARASSRLLGPEQLLRDLRAQAGLARAAMARQAGRRSLFWSFSVAQGRSEDALLRAAVRGDIIALSRSFGPLARGRLGRRLRLLAARAPGPLLLLGDLPARPPGPILLPFDASAAAEAMLGIAAAFARAEREPLEILLLGAARGGQADIQARLRGLAGEGPLPALRFRTAPDTTGLARRFAEADRGLLALPVGAPCIAPEEVERIIERVRLPLLLQAEGISFKALEFPSSA